MATQMYYGYHGYRPPAPPLAPAPAPAPGLGPGAAPWIINECRIEGEKCFVVAYQLDGLCQAIPPAYRAHIIATAEEARATGNQLRALADASYRHFQRVDLMINYLNVALPSIKKTLADITKHYEDRTKAREMRWRTMYHQMTSEAGGVPLPQRFVLYSAYLSGLLQLLVRDVHFDDNRFQSNRDLILTLTGQQKLPAPTELVPFRQATAQLQIVGADENIHWAEDIFSRPLPSRTLLRHLRPSEAFGPFAPMGQQPPPPPSSRILFEREFDEGSISVSVYEDRVRKVPYVLLTKRQMGGAFYAQMGAHELGIQRNRSAIELRRWSRRENRPVLWAVLYFVTWEELVLFYWAFVSLKINSPSTTLHNPNEFTPAGEKRLFQAKILDDGYNHSLIVYKDKYTKGWRLHAAVWDGELRQAPMWTAFISEICKEPKFLKRKSTRRIWLYDIDIYTFTSDYHPEHQRHGRGGGFEIRFDSEPGAQHFVELFQPSSTEPSEATASTADSSDERAADDDDGDRRDGGGHKTVRDAQVKKALSASTSTSASNATSEDGGSNVGGEGQSREQSGGENETDEDDDHDEERMVHSEDVSESGAGDDSSRSSSSDGDNNIYSEANSETRHTDRRRHHRRHHQIRNRRHTAIRREDEDAKSEDLHSDEPPRREPPPGHLADYVDYIRPGEISVEEVISGEEDDDSHDDGHDNISDRGSSQGAWSDEATLRIGRRESLLDAPEELHQLEGPEELSRLEAPREPAKITDGRPPKPSVEDCTDEEDIK